ncbi:sulfite exporter TauE/SafE family protein [Pyrobaculum sp.]|uniref:sulfite exporter TauE/SafE family protein n=1 Tax=Pyrobaculum sp. TaxID=2004705 RepID=UPI003178599B
MIPPLEFLGLVLGVSAFSGLLGALTGLGGGAFLVPIYTLYMGIPFPYAAGASLISTIATSSGSASVYIRKGIVNVRIGVGLAVATTTGSIIGSILVARIYAAGLEHVLYLIFGAVLLAQIYVQWSRSKSELPPPRDPDWTTRMFQLWGRYYDEALGREVEYHGVRWWLGALIMLAAGVVSSLLGIGAGVLKVLAMDWAMNIPMKVSTTTSNYMIGITAATSSAVYWAHGYIQPFLAAGTALGVLAGSYVGTRLLMRTTGRKIRYIFIAILAYLGVRMVLRGLGYGF